jgi:hypothetical protein
VIANRFECLVSLHGENLLLGLCVEVLTFILPY